MLVKTIQNLYLSMRSSVKIGNTVSGEINVNKECRVWIYQDQVHKLCILMRLCMVFQVCGSKCTTSRELRH